MKEQPLSVAMVREPMNLSRGSSSLGVYGLLPEEGRAHLTRMFRDPRVLNESERMELVAQLRGAVGAEPTVAGLRVLFGMALCVNLEVQEALAELRTAVELDPESFIARLKLGELLMRLRICSEAAEQTHVAAQLADTDVQSELARRQATAVREMLREGVERGGYRKVTSALGRTGRWVARFSPRQTAATLTSR